jgi:hypothetical protein
MRRSRAARALVLTALACLLAAAPALTAASVRGEAESPPAERPAWTERAHEALVSLWERLMLVIAPEEPTKGDRTPGSGLDPDGHKPPVK